MPPADIELTPYPDNIPIRHLHLQTEDTAKHLPFILAIMVTHQAPTGIESTTIVSYIGQELQDKVMRV